MLTRRVLLLALHLLIPLSASAHERLWSLFEPDASTLFPNTGVERNGASGLAVGDVDGDGVPEIALGWPGVGLGRVELRSGATGAQLWALDGDVANAYPLGIALERVGDLDLDGVDDLAVGSDHVVLLLSSGSGAVLRRLDPSLPGSAYRFGSALAAVGDQDGDGFDELLIGDRQGSCIGAGDHYTCSTVGPGYAELRSTRDGSLLSLIAPGAGFQWGSSALRFPDLDGDGRPEYALGAILQGSGWILDVRSGASAQFVAQLQVSDSNLEPRLRAALLPDLDGDGREELLLYEIATSSVRLLSGATGAQVWSRNGFDFWVWPLAPVGDWDGDGKVDVAVGSDQRPSCVLGCSHEGPGYVEILSGHDGSTLEQLVGKRIDDRFGAAFGSLGDLDGDGRHELWVASASAREGGVDGRRIEVLRGAPELVLPRAYCESYSDAGPSISWAGSTSVSQDQLSLTLSGAQPGALAVLVFGADASATAFGCIAQPLQRVIARVADGSGAAQAQLDLRRWTTSPADPLAPGTTWSFAWFLRPASSAPTGWSSALRATFTP